MEFYFDKTLKANKIWILVIQMLIGVEIKKIKEALLYISFKYLVLQSHGARESNIWWHYRRVRAEYITWSYVTCQSIWITYVLEEIKIEMKKHLVLLIDNKSAINLAKNLVLHGIIKHIKARFQFLRDKVNQSELEVIHYSSEAQLACIFTKGSKIDNFLTLRKKLGILQINND